MGLPKVRIVIQNGQLGKTAEIARKYALVGSGATATGLALGVSKQFFDIDEVKAAGIDAAFDTSNTVEVFKQCQEYYDKAGKGAELWLMMVSKTVTMAQMADKNNSYAKKLMEDAGSALTMLGIFRTPDNAYAPTITEGLDPDVRAAELKAEELVRLFRAENNPLRMVIGARDFQGTASALRDFRTSDSNGVQLCFFETLSGKKTGAVGYLLGLYASLPLQRKISRRKNGALGLEDAYMTNGLSTLGYKNSWDSMHDKGYVFAIKIPNETGFFLNDDSSCSPKTDDYSVISRGLVIDKAQRISANVLENELHDDFDVDEKGFPDPAVIKNIQNEVERNITAQMIPENITEVRVVINPKQNLLSQTTFKIEKIGVRPKGFADFIDVNLGFDVQTVNN